MAETAFSRTQLDETYPPGIERHFWNHARNRIILRTLRAAAGASPFRNVLEIGCGRGVVVRYLRDHGVPCRGVELSRAAVDPDLTDLIETGRDCFTLPDAVRHAVECVLLLDVIEHLPDPVAFLAAVRLAFPAARAVVVTVPARRELWSNYDEYYGHFRRYTVASLRGEVAAAGFSALRCGYLFHALYPVMFLLARIAGTRTTVQRTPRHLGLHRLLAHVLVADSLVVPSGVVGTSVLCVAVPLAAA